MKRWEEAEDTLLIDNKYRGARQSSVQKHQEGTSHKEETGCYERWQLPSAEKKKNYSQHQRQNRKKNRSYLIGGRCTEHNLLLLILRICHNLLLSNAFSKCLCASKIFEAHRHNHNMMDKKVLDR